jgi:hypothetical protein
MTEISCRNLRVFALACILIAGVSISAPAAAQTVRYNFTVIADTWSGEFNNLSESTSISDAGDVLFIGLHQTLGIPELERSALFVSDNLTRREIANTDGEYAFINSVSMRA